MQIAHAKRRFEQMVFAAFLGVNIVEVTHERAVLHLPYQVAHSNPGGTLNGGVTASLINLAGTLAAWTGITSTATLFWARSISLYNTWRRQLRKMCSPRPRSCVEGVTCFFSRDRYIPRIKSPYAKA
jgi:hypothetical protein